MPNTQDAKQSKSVSAGDIWECGRHILACGDATDQAFIAKVMDPLGTGPAKVRQILCDPPYGVAYEGGMTQSREKIAGDQLQSEEQYTAFTKAWLMPVVPFLDAYNTAYIFNGDSMFPALRLGMKAAGWYFSQLVIWVKSSVVMGRRDHLQQHELIAYGWYGKHKMERGKSKSVLFYPKMSANKLHPTMKPVGLLRQLILNSTNMDDVVYDPFGGSGSTLMACEHTRRRCVTVELDAAYAAIIIQRWETLTGGVAVCIHKSPSI